MPTAFALAGMIAAYNESEDWVAGRGDADTQQSKDTGTDDTSNANALPAL